jgi:bifunctional DNA-binding transcriptional regulator/antitoxin component of YhaV-PrlF toxin-antitoxin module
MNRIRNPYIAKLFRSGTTVVISIPKKLRKFLNLLPGDHVEVKINRKIECGKNDKV